jgi:hypothetical protein
MGLVYISEQITKGQDISSVRIKIYFSGEINWEISNDDGITWEELILTSGTFITHIFSSIGDIIRLRAIGQTGSEISTQLDIYGNKDYPAINMEIV